MKKTYKSSLLALSVLASFTSCSESESLQQANLSKDKITFHATLDNTWKPLSPASSSRAAIAAATEKGPIVVPTPFGKPLYLHSVVQDGIHIWSKEGKPITRSGAPLEDVEHERVAQTRGTMSTKIGDYGSFGVTAIYKEEDNNVLLLDNAEAEKTDGEFWGFTNNSNARWPIGSTVSFHAYAPHSSADKSMLTYGVDKDNVQTQITYTASTTADDIINQPDLIVATNTGSRQLSDADDAVQLDFYHALTAVSFAIDKDLADVVGKGGKMTSVTLKGIPNKGNCNLSVSATANVPTAAWTMENGTGEYTFDLSNADIVVGDKDQALTSANQTLMMIPQTLPEGAELCFKLDMNGTTQEWKVPLKGQVWEAGKSIIYKLSSNSINMLDDAKVVYPDTWTAHSFPKKSFGENDVVGLYVVNKFNQIVAENVQLTKTKGEENTFTWKTKDNKNFSFSPHNKYFAYYPYSESMTKGEGTAATATDFFKTKISSLANDNNVVADQSAKETLLAQDFQVATGTIGPDAGSIVFNMEHQVGLAVINLKSKTVAETRQFTKDTYKYYYGEGNQPAAGDYHDFNIELMASDQFEVNKPYKADDAGKKYLQIIPIGKSLKYNASNQTESEIPTGWGKMTGTDFSMSPSVTRSVVEKDFRPDYAREFYRLARLYTNDKYDKGQIDEFSIPEITQYKLECWGASSWGADKTNYGGGYSYGNYTATDKNKILYVCAGGEGVRGGYNTNPNDFHVGGKGGYNGGGNAGNGNGYNGRYDQSGGGNGGGGATHIAFKTGLLTVFENTYRDDVLLVAGGQGGATAYADYDLSLPIYSFGGGKTGAGVYAPFIPQNGGVNMGGLPVSEESHDGALFGRGGDGRTCINTPAPVYSGSRGGGGGGGGLWGGLTFKGTYQYSDCSGGGGCGYVNSTHLQNPNTIEGNQEFLSPSRTKEMGHKGGGAAQISWLPSQLTRVK